MEMMYPIFSLVVLTFVVGFSVGLSRLLAVRKGHVDPGYYKLLSGYPAPDYMVKLARNFSNLLEVPVLFYVLGVLVIALGISSPLILNFAWAYVALRVVHTIIHVTYNNPMLRFLVFLPSMVLLLIMWVQVFVEVTQR